MIRLSRRYSFSASHRLFSNDLSEERNREIYGKCANPYGHGHNYEVEVTVAGETDPVTGRVVILSDLDTLVEQEILEPFRYKNLNQEIEAFRNAVPTTENLVFEVDRRLRQAWAQVFTPPVAVRLERVRIWETERNICEMNSELRSGV